MVFSVEIDINTVDECFTYLQKNNIINTLDLIQVIINAMVM